MPSHYAELIRLAKKTGRQYNPIEMSLGDFVSLKTLAQDMGIKTNSFKISDVKIMKLMVDTATKLFYKTSFKQT